MHKLEVLENGLRVASLPMDYMESASIGVWIRAGGRFESAKNNGISHLLEHLLFKGTANRDMMTIKQEIEGRGGSFNGFTSEEHTCYLVKVLSKDAQLGLDILSDMVLHPKLDEEEIKKEKDVIVEEINMYKDVPSHYVHEILAEIMWPAQPLGLPLAGTVESVKAITRNDLVKYKEAYYNPKNILVAAAGKIKEDKLAEFARKYFLEAPPGPVSNFQKVTLEQKSARLNLTTKQTEQTHMALGFHTVDRFHPDRHILSLLNIVLGANMSSRLFHIVRDEMALCYEISSSIRRYDDCGAFVVSAGVDNKKVARALEVILGELARMKKEPVTAGELARAKEYYKGQLLFALEDTMNHMLWLGEKIISNEKDFSVQNILAKIDAAKPGDLARVAGDMLKTSSMNLAVIGPIENDSEIRGALALT